MRKPTYRMIIIALAATVVAPPLSALTQQELDQQHRQSGPTRRPTITPRQPVQTINPPRARVEPSPQGARLVHGPLPSHNLGGQVYHGDLAWEHGRWHHETRNGRYGWWWDVGRAWYFYPEPIEGPPAYVSDTDVVEEATGDAAPPPQESHHAFYYYPGDIKGVPYETIEECLQARQRDGDVGVCVMK